MLMEVVDDRVYDLTSMSMVMMMMMMMVEAVLGLAKGTRMLVVVLAGGFKGNMMLLTCVCACVWLSA